MLALADKQLSSVLTRGPSGICNHQTLLFRTVLPVAGRLRTFISKPSTYNLSSLTNAAPTGLISVVFPGLLRANELKNVMDCHTIKENKTRVVIGATACWCGAERPVGSVAPLQTRQPRVAPFSTQFASPPLPTSITVQADRYASNC